MIPDNAWQFIWDHVVREFRGDIGAVHGSAHWRRVERNGLLLAPRTGAVVDVVRLIAVLHDSRREQDGWDGGHGARAADYAASLRGVLFELNDADQELLRYACTWHAYGKLSEDPTIGTCWDADRLDLGRVGRQLHPRYMSTEFGREIAASGSIEPFIDGFGSAAT
jgi:uncharacterized protein